MNRPVSIIIPLYRRTDWIGLCLAALKEQDFSGYAPEVVIVDDGSPNAEEVRAAVCRASDGFILPIHFFCTENAGPASARNKAVKQSKGELICFLDDDSVPDQKWFTAIVRSFADAESVGIVSGRTCSYDRKNLLPLLLEQTVYAGKTFATCNIAYRRDVFESLGGFDESFSEPSWEDNDLGLRAIWAGALHVYNPDAVVYHPHEATLAEYKDKCRLNGRGAAAFSRKYLWSKPLWGVMTPFVMSRRLIYGLSPRIWFSRRLNEQSVKLIWSLFSLMGFLGAVTGKRRAKK